MRSRPVKPRASLMAVMVASVPEFTRRTLSMPGTLWTISSASSISSSVGAPNPRACSACDRTAATTRGSLWPRIIGPQEAT